MSMGWVNQVVLGFLTNARDRWSRGLCLWYLVVSKDFAMMFSIPRKCFSRGFLYAVVHWEFPRLPLPSRTLCMNNIHWICSTWHLNGGKLSVDHMIYCAPIMGAQPHYWVHLIFNDNFYHFFKIDCSCIHSVRLETRAIVGLNLLLRILSPTVVSHLD